MWVLQLPTICLCFFPYNMMFAFLNSRVLNRRAFRDELELLQKIRHPNVVQFLGAVTQSNPMMIVTEYLPKVYFSLHNPYHLPSSLMFYLYTFSLRCPELRNLGIIHGSFIFISILNFAGWSSSIFKEERSTKANISSEVCHGYSKVFILVAFIWIITHFFKCPIILTNDALLSFFRGMNYLHENKPEPIIHRDLEPS